MGETAKMKVVKLSFEHVKAISYPQYYRGDRPAVSADDVPDEHWTRTERTGEGIWDQYDGLQELMYTGELIRNVFVYEAEVPVPEWRDVTPASPPGEETR